MDKFFNCCRPGQSLIEILIVIGMLAIILPALLTGMVASRSGKAQQQQRVAALALIKEMDTAIRSIRERGWEYVETDGTYYTNVNGSDTFWSLVGCSPDCPPTADGFNRSIVISTARRDANGHITLSGGTPDPSTKQVVITVSWSTPYTTSMVWTLYLTRRTNLTYTETLQAQFNSADASRTNLKVQASAPLPIPTPDDGEIMLAQTGGFGDWCNPSAPIKTQDLPKSGVANAVSALAAGGMAAAGTGDNASGVSYAQISITDPPYPAVPDTSIGGTFDAGSPPIKTNGVFNDELYGYLATDRSRQQGIIIRQSDYKAVGYLDAGTGSVRGNSVYVLNNIAYLTASDNKLYTFDIATRSSCTPSSPCIFAPIGNKGLLGGEGKKIIVVGSNAYVAVNATSNQLQIINVSNPRTMPDPVGITVDGVGATDIFVNVPQSRAYLVTSMSSQKEFFLINLANNSVIGSYNTTDPAHPEWGNMSPKGVIAVSGSKVIIVGTGGQEYQVLRVEGEYETHPFHCGGRDEDTGINGIAAVFTAATTKRAFSYIITGDANAEFKILEGGPGGTGAGDYVPTGTFISQPFKGPGTYLNTFNSFSANFYQPAANPGLGFYGIQIQVAVADTDSNGNCTNSQYNFIGTDSGGTGATHFFTTSATGATNITAAVPLNTYSTYHNPDKCFKYKVILNTNDSTLTPVFKDMTVNYSP